jgi:hypothetical protein
MTDRTERVAVGISKVLRAYICSAQYQSGRDRMGQCPLSFSESELGQLRITVLSLGYSPILPPLGRPQAGSDARVHCHIDFEWWGFMYPCDSCQRKMDLNFFGAHKCGTAICVRCGTWRWHWFRGIDGIVPTTLNETAMFLGGRHIFNGHYDLTPHSFMVTTRRWIADRTATFDSSGIRKVFELAAKML